MKKRFLSNLEMGLRFSSWPTALIGIVVIKAVLSFAVRPGSFLVSYSSISYFLLLLLATAFAIRNGIQNTLKNRPFWVFLAIAYGLWGLDQGLNLYYELGRHVAIPDDSIADTLLFLHLVPLMAAIANLPHRKVSDRESYRAILNSLLIPFFWTFLYGYVVFPYQYLYSTSSYAWRFDSLYLLENLMVVSAVAILSLRVEAPWRSIYLHLLGASSLYAISSAVANFAIDSNGYVNGKLYGWGLTASACWFVWVPLRARQVSGGEIKEQPDSHRSQGSRASVWPLPAVLVISIPIVWELFERNEDPGLRTIRVVVAIAAFVCIASAAYIREYLARRELSSHVGVVNDQLRLAMQAGTCVGWDFDVTSGRNLWFGDLKTVFGIPSETYLAAIGEFTTYVHPDDRQRVSEALAHARQNRRPYAEEFRILRADGTIRWLTARGKFYFSATGDPERMVGVSLDITERKLAEDKLREYEKAVESSEEMIAVVDRDYRYLIANRMFLSRRNMTKEQVVGHFAYEVLSKGVFESVVKEKLDQCFQDNVVRFEMKYTYPVLGERDVLVSYFPIEGSTGVDRVACIVQDITERKRAEEALSRASSRVIQVEERERSRIAMDLHENIGQRLALLAIAIEQLKNDLPNHSADVLDRMDTIWMQTIEILTDVKASAHELYSPRLEYLPFAKVVKSFCREFGERQRVEIHFTERDVPSFVPPDVSICLFRVLQEALQNAVRHSGAKKYEVVLWSANDDIHLKVSDNGVGFVVESAWKGQGLGLSSIEERLRLVKGTFSVESQPGLGTRVYAHAPLVGASRPAAAS
jgi:PAS domain S-box-containing protein